MSVLDRHPPPLAKVCGLTGEADVRAALAAGADLLGFVSHSASPRHLADRSLVELTRQVHGHGGSSVLVVVDADRSTVEALVDEGRIDAVQLCGSEDPMDWEGAPFTLLRRLGVDAAAEEEAARWRGCAGAFVLDHPAAAGGTGRRVDGALAAALARRFPCLLAGGLDAAAVAAFERPEVLLGFDASSRLELEPGRKCPHAVLRFVEAAHASRRSSDVQEGLAGGPSTR